MLRLVAPLTVHVSIELLPVVTQAGLAVKLEITGAVEGGPAEPLLPPHDSRTQSSDPYRHARALPGSLSRSRGESMRRSAGYCPIQVSVRLWDRTAHQVRIVVADDCLHGVAGAGDSARRQEATADAPLEASTPIEVALSNGPRLSRIS